MEAAQIWVALALVPVVVIVVCTAWVARQHRAAALEVRRMRHTERLAAIEKDLLLLDELDEVPIGPATTAAVLQLRALLSALVLIFGGIGFAGAMLMIPVTRETGGLRELAAFGVIPVSVGCGLLLFAWLVSRWRA